MTYGRALSAVTALIALAIAGPAYANSRITGLSDVAFGTIAAVTDQNRSQNVCVYSIRNSNGPRVGYSVRATGSGTSGAFTLASGAAILPYEVRWDDASNQTTGTQLTAGVAQSGFANGSTSQTCSNGENASLTVTIRGTQLSAATAGSYSGMLQITIVPN